MAVKALRKERMRKVFIVVAALAAALVVSSVGQAHTGNASISCTEVSFSYTSFANSNGNTISESITVDGASVYAGNFVFNGSSGGHTVGLSLAQDGTTYTVVVSASWNTNGHSGSFSESARVTCGEKPVPTPIGPYPVCPDGLPPNSGKDGEEGNDDCERKPGVPIPVPVPPTGPPVVTGPVEVAPPKGGVVTVTPKKPGIITIKTKGKPDLRVGVPKPSTGDQLTG